MNECAINDLELYNNSWRRWFLIKLRNLARLVRLYSPYIFFALISYTGTKTGEIIYDKYLKINSD
jgi:hypothetical protein